MSEDVRITEFGVDARDLVLQVLLLLHLCLWGVALFRVRRSFRGTARTGWVLVGLVVPIIGPIAAMMAARSHLASAKNDVEA